MRIVDLAAKLVSAKNSSERKRLLARHKNLADLRLAKKLKEVCYAAWTSEPTKARRAGAALNDLSRVKVGPPSGTLVHTRVSARDHEEIFAYASWVTGIANVTKGKLEAAIASFDDACAAFRTAGNEHDAVQTQVAKLMALALLGRYEDAVRTGEAALKVFSRLGDDLAAGKIEMNLANMFSRREMHAESKQHGLSALHRFAKIGEKSWQTMAENDIAITFTQLNDFRNAERYYRKALETAKEARMLVTEAEIEASIGNLALMRGDYARALRFLELSRQKYEDLKMPHGKAVAELEIADIYAQLNLAEEALEIYTRVADVLKKLKLRREEARARDGAARAAAVLRKSNTARREFEKAAKLFADDGNAIGLAAAKTELAFFELSRGATDAAEGILSEIEATLRSSENPRHGLAAELLLAEVKLREGEIRDAEKLFRSVSKKAARFEFRPALRSALNSLGKIAAEQGRTKSAEAYFKKSIDVMEESRGGIAADEFRVAFLATNLEPFENLLRIYLSQGKLDKAFAVTERSRGRSLLESVGGDNFSIEADKVPKRLTEKAAALREELNWLYARRSGAPGAEAVRLERDTRKREKTLTDVLRQIGSVRAASGKRLDANFDLKQLQKAIGPERALLEFAKIDESFGVFVVTENTLNFVPDLSREEEISRLLEDLHFQFSGMRYGKKLSEPIERQLKARADIVMNKLHDKLIAPLKDLIGRRDLIVIPAGSLNYLPFHAFHDGERYLIEEREVVYSPSASVWQMLNEKPRRKPKNAFFIGFADEKIPLVNEEVRELASAYPNSKALAGRNATYAAYTRNAPKFDILHIACHGQFRADNPMYSSLHLADGWITVRDVCAQNLRANLVTLSACETGLNKISAGEEILGLARGFLSAGAGSLILSLWTVNDEAARELMGDLYGELRSGAAASQSLRRAQIEQIGKNRHPYLWSPFIYVGR